MPARSETSARMKKKRIRPRSARIPRGFTGCWYRVIGVSAPGGRTACPFPSEWAARPTPRFSVVFILEGNVRSALAGARGQDSSGDGRSGLWLVGEIGAKPAFHLREADSLPRGVVLRLVKPYPADGEVARLRMGEVDAADARRRHGRERLGQLDADLLRGEEPIERLLLAVVGTGRVAVRRPDPAEALGDQLLVRELRARLLPLAPGGLVQVLGEGLRKPVGERLDHDRAVVVVLGLVPGRKLVGAVDRDREAAHVVAGRG